MKNIDIDEWLLNNNIDPNTEIVADEKQWFLSDILEKHLKEQFAIHSVSNRRKLLIATIEKVRYNLDGYGALTSSQIAERLEKAINCR